MTTTKIVAALALAALVLCGGRVEAAGTLAEDPFAPDPAFWSGLYRQDDHALPQQNGSAWAQRIVRLTDGDVIVAGRVPATAAGSVAANNLGLSKYGPDGAFVSGGWDIVKLPDDPNGLYADVHAVRRVGDQIVVLVDVANPPPGFRTVVLHAFALDSGELLQTRLVFQGNYHFHGADFVPVSHFSFGQKLVVVGTRMFNGQGRPVLRRYGIAADGSIEADAPMQLLDVGVCGPAQDCRVRAIASAGGNVGAAPRLYLAGTFQWGGAPAKDYFVARLDIDGVADTSGFGALGMAVVGFDQPGSDNDDELVAVAARNAGNPQVADDRVYLVGNVARRCKPGIGVARLSHHGSLDAGFGQGGRLVFGGDGSDPGHVPCLFASRDEARDAVLSMADRRLAIVGRTTRACPVPPCAPNEHGLFAIVDGDDGSLREHRSLPAVGDAGIDRHSELLAVTGNGAGRFLATGYVRHPDDHADPDLAGKRRFATLGAVSDRLFGHGFDP